MDRRGQAIGMRDGYLRGSQSMPATPRQLEVLAAFVAAGGSVSAAARVVGIRSTAKSATWLTCEPGPVSLPSS